MKYILFLITLMTFSLHAEEIIVQLETEVTLMPLYQRSFFTEEPGLDRDYVAELEKILTFDFEHNGMNRIVPQKEELDRLVTSFDKPISPSEWQKKKITYLVIGKVKDKKVSLKLMSVNNNTIRSFDDVNLTGDLSRDRRTIHGLSDALFKALYGTEGIANTRILYTLRKKGQGSQWTSDIWESDYDGGNAHPVTKNAGYCVTPTYVPQKKGELCSAFMYVSYLNGQPKIFCAKLQEGQGQRMTLLRGNQLMPALSRQCDQMAFISDVTGNPDLFLVGIDRQKGALDKPRQIFTANRSVQGTPTFSPDGTQIAFVSNKDGSARIYTMPIPAQGTRIEAIKPKLITKQTRENTAPAWSPDGTKIAYCAQNNGVRQIWVYDCHTGKERQLTEGAGNKENPTWAPNSLHLIFNSTGSDNSELYVINLNQPKATKISKGSGEKHYPCWEMRAL